jgi:hypothetical protein
MTDPHHGITFRIEYGWIKITMGAAMQIALPMCIDPAFRYPNRIPIRICFTGIRFTYRPNKRLPVPEPASEALNQPPWSLLRLWNLLQKFSFRIPRSHWERGIRIFKRLSLITRQIRRQMRNGFSPWIRALGGIVKWKKPRVENLVTLSLS